MRQLTSQRVDKFLMVTATDGTVLHLTIPTRQQLLAQLDSMCPVCETNDETAGAMARQFGQAMRRQVAGQRIAWRKRQWNGLKRSAGKAMAYAKAKTGGPADDVTAAARLAQCRHGEVFCRKCNKLAAMDHETDQWMCLTKDCGWRISRADGTQGANACSAYMKRPDGEFCGSCGCGFRADAELKTKAKMAYATCPRKLWPLHKKKQIESEKEQD